MNNNSESEMNFNEYKENRKRKIIIVALLIVLLGIGYAYLQTTLNITGTSKVKDNTWSVYWDDIQVTAGSVALDPVMVEPDGGGEPTPSIPPKPDLDSNNTSITFGVSLSKPGDYYEFTVKAKNNGSIDAMISLIKGGAFDLMVDRVECMKDYLWANCNKKTNLTLQNLPGLIKYNLVPQNDNNMRLATGVYNFNKYLKEE